MRTVWRLLAFPLVLITLSSATILTAQTFRGTLLGTVSDATGAVLPGASISVKNMDTGIERTTESNGAGEFTVPELPVGRYSLSVTMTGFNTYHAEGVEVTVGSQVNLNIKLQTGAEKEEVVVSANALQVETTTDTLGQTLTTNDVKNLPVNGRDYTKLIYLSPGVSGSPDQISDSPGSFGAFSVNGARGRSNNFLLDGTDMNDGYRNDPAVNEPGVFGAPATILPIDAVSELKVISNFEPEYGRSAGGVINIVTKSGTNDFHGTAAEYFRNNALDARNYFNPRGQAQAPFHNNQFGGSIGGPIIRNRTFFYFDYEGQRESVGTVSQACVPDPAEIASLGGATNPVMASLLARNPWPAPNLSGVTTSSTGCSAPNAAVIAPSSNLITSLIAKVDHNFNQNNMLSGRYFYGDSTQSFPLALSGGGILPGFNTFTPTRVQLVSISLVSVFGSNKVNEARFGWNRFAEGFFPEDRSFQPSSIGLNVGTGSADEGLPVIAVGNYSIIGASKSDPRQRFDTNWQGFDNFSWTAGKHSVKFGYEFRRTTITQFLGTNFRGRLVFNTLDDFLAGNVASGTQSQGYSQRHSYQNNNGVYVQDSYRVMPTLTLNYGLRWDYYGVFHEKNNLLSNITAFDPAAATITLTQVGQPGLSSLYQPDYKNFAPRVSFSFDPRGKGQTVFRGGFGVFFDAYSQDVFLAHLPYNSTFDPGPTYNPFGPAPIFSVTANGGTIVSGQPVFAAPGGTPAGDIFSVERNMRSPYLMNFNVNVQQQFGRHALAQIGYVGSLGRRLLRFRDINQPGQSTITATDIAFAQANTYPDPVTGNPVPCYPGGGPGCIPAYNAASRVYANNPYGAFYINQEESTAYSNYNSLQINLRVPDWHGISTILNYNFSHSLDNASDSEDFVPNASQPNNSMRPDLEYGDSNFDVRNRFTWVFGYQLPASKEGRKWLRNGWGFDSAVTLQDGQPFNLNYNFEDDYSGSGEGFDRPDIIAPPSYRTNPALFLNLGTFAIPCSLTSFALDNGITGTAQDCVPGTRHFGNLGRDSLRGLSYKNWDLGLYKTTNFTERFTMQLRVDFFNLPNHPNFASPLLPAFIADAAPNGFSQGGSSEVGAGFYPITATGDVGLGNPFLGGGGPRGIQLAAKFSF
jgi:Carboxypeptidase regulatory-like domain/TonB-dependent Receptor Plug Domain/TonB dependent receptor